MACNEKFNGINIKYRKTPSDIGIVGIPRSNSGEDLENVGIRVSREFSVGRSMIRSETFFRCDLEMRRSFFRPANLFSPNFSTGPKFVSFENSTSRFIAPATPSSSIQRELLPERRPSRIPLVARISVWRFDCPTSKATVSFLSVSRRTSSSPPCLCWKS